MRKKFDPLTDPLPAYRRHLARAKGWWLRTGNQRSETLRTLRKAGRRGLTLAISLLGLTLVSFGVYSIHAPAGYVTGGILLWALQWNYGSREGSDG